MRASRGRARPVRTPRATLGSRTRASPHSPQSRPLPRARAALCIRDLSTRRKPLPLRSERITLWRKPCVEAHTHTGAFVSLCRLYSREAYVHSFARDLYISRGACAQLVGIDWEEDYDACNFDTEVGLDECLDEDEFESSSDERGLFRSSENTDPSSTRIICMRGKRDPRYIYEFEKRNARRYCPLLHVSQRARAHSGVSNLEYMVRNVRKDSVCGKTL